ncbi:MAG: aspartate aminotransferase family protein, partial [Aeromicrobium sp.]
MTDPGEALRHAVDAAIAFRSTLDDRAVAGPIDLESLSDRFGTSTPDQPLDPAAVVEELVRAAEPGLVATPGPRFFGFVIGGSLPSAAAADILATGWDQCAFNG